MKNTYSGTLIYNNLGEYELGKTNISEILNIIYRHPTNNHIQIKMTNKTKTLFNEDGVLYYKPILPGLYSLHVSGEDIETVLFDNVGEELEITISAEALEGTPYGRKQFAS